MIDVNARNGGDGFFIQAGDDARPLAAVMGGVECNNAPASGRETSRPREIGRTAGTADGVAVGMLQIALPEQIHFER